MYTQTKPVLKMDSNQPQQTEQRASLHPRWADENAFIAHLVMGAKKAAQLNDHSRKTKGAGKIVYPAMKYIKY
jgi:hypothetical protein